MISAPWLEPLQSDSSSQGHFFAEPLVPSFQQPRTSECPLDRPLQLPTDNTTSRRLEIREPRVGETGGVQGPKQLVRPMARSDREPSALGRGVSGPPQDEQAQEKRGPHLRLCQTWTDRPRTTSRCRPRSLRAARGRMAWEESARKPALEWQLRIIGGPQGRKPRAGSVPRTTWPTPRSALGRAALATLHVVGQFPGSSVSSTPLPWGQWFPCCEPLSPEET